MKFSYIIFIITILLLAACSQQTETIKIGGNFALTGKLAFYGLQEKNGLELAILDINEKGGIEGKKIEFIVEDNQGDAKNAVTAMQKLLDVDQVEVVFSGFTHITQAIAPVANQANKLMIYQSTVADMARASPLTFRDYFDNGQQGAALAEYATKMHTNFSYIGESSDVCEGFYENFSENIDGEIVIKQAFDSKEKDFSTMLLKAKAKNPEALVFCTWRSEDIVMKQLEELDWLNISTYHLGAPFLPSSSAANPQFKKNRAVSTWYGFTATTKDPKIRQFIEKYRTKYGEEPSPDALYAYDDGMFLAQAIEYCGNTDSVCLSDALLTQSYDGLAGELRFDKDGVALRPTLLIRYEDEGWTEIT